MNSTVFDLSDLVPEMDRILRPKRFLLLGFGLLGILAGAAGWWLLLTAPQSRASAPPFLFGTLFLGIMFPIIAAISFWVLPSFPPSPHRILLDASGMRVERNAGETGSIILRWEDPKFRLTIYDLRPLGETWQDNSTPRKLDFVALVRRVRFPLSSDATKHLLDEAIRHGLRIKGWESNPTVPGPVRTVTIRHRA